MKKIICLVMLIQCGLAMAQTQKETVVTANGKKVQIAVNAIDSVNNGLTRDKSVNKIVQLGGNLTKATLITTTASNTLALQGLQTGAATDKMLVADSNGVIKWVTRSGDAWILDGNTNGALRTIGTKDAFDLPFMTANAEKMRLTAAGYLGINTSAPASAVHVVNNGKTDGFDDVRISTFGTPGVATPSLILTNAAGTEGSPQNLANGNVIGGIMFQPRFNNAFASSSSINSVYKGNGTTNLSNINFTTSGSARMIIDENGSVGIGTITPTNTLHVKANFDPVRLEGLQLGSLADKIVLATAATGVLKTIGADVFWQTKGNMGTNSTTNFIGTTDSVDLIFKTANVESGRLSKTKWTSFGYQAMNNSNSGSESVAFGQSALYSNVSGGYNSAVGASAFYNSTGSENTGLGYYAFQALSSGDKNVGVGSLVATGLITGSQNIAIGNSALVKSVTSGNENVVIGTTSGGILGVGSGSVDQSVIIGSSAKVLAFGQTNQIVIGYQAIGKGSNSVRLGNSSVSYIGGQVAWSSDSDARLKKDITTSTYGLNFITKLRPVTYFMKSGPTDLQTGFIAQEVEAAANSIGYEFNAIVKPQNDQDFYSLRYSEFVVPLVKAVQEQQKQIEDKDVKIKELEERILKIEQLLAK